MTFIIPLRFLFFHLAIPFYWGVGGALTSYMIPFFSEKEVKTLVSYSPLLSVLRRLIVWSS